MNPINPELLLESLAPKIEFVDGLILLSDKVREYFTLRNLPVEVPPVGLKNRSRWPEQRVHFIDGEYDGSTEVKALKAGRLEQNPEHTKSDDPRELYTWARVCTVCVYAKPKDPEDEQDAIRASSRLLELTLRAMYNAKINIPGPLETGERGFIGQVSIDFSESTVTRVYPPVELSAGVELLVTFIHRGPFFDSPSPTIIGSPGTLNRDWSTSP